MGEYIDRKTQKIKEITFEIRFIDSLKFQQASLARLVGNLENKHFVNTRRKFKEHTVL